MVIRRLGVLAAGIVLAAVLASSSFAADPQIGFVNVQEVFQGYQKTAKSNSELDSLSKQFVAKLQVMEEHLLLSDDELNSLVALKAKENATDQEKTRVQALQDKQIALDKELADLSAKKEPTAQDSARLKELQDKQSKSKEAVETIRSDSEKSFAAKSKELSSQIRDDIIKAIEAVAKDKKMSVVVDKEAVLFGGVDITTDVLTKLSKNKN